MSFEAIRKRAAHKGEPAVIPADKPVINTPAEILVLAKMRTEELEARRLRTDAEAGVSASEFSRSGARRVRRLEVEDHQGEQSR